MFLEGVVAGQDMLSFADLACTAIECHPPIREFVELWLTPVVGASTWLQPEEWLIEGHGMTGGQRDLHGIWTPTHARNRKAYIWMPPPIIADVALEECLKAMHKHTDVYHVFLIPRLYPPPLAVNVLQLSDFVFHLSLGSLHGPATMREPLFVSIALPSLSRPFWTL